ncbi:hypothetical protein H696_04652 [Fonticula alba]|uniref:Uncharacterized protein n=1 Tax=Fonticula alba TaxID=691883 RepID=A0A058Z4N6_FONAL|nr:hypothetical protein H696_04652 [Fonticula alba]KCV69235.1 hypothetical protein H696_04652 [Fonticula alba]|eukprot:XP_009496806.1 hypothetical protein H696_04652 [Fonticula alba]
MSSKTTATTRSAAAAGNKGSSSSRIVIPPSPPLVFNSSPKALYHRYRLLFSLNMLEAWEEALFTSILVLVISLSLYRIFTLF